MHWGKEPVRQFHWVSSHANTPWLYDTNQSTSSKGQWGSSEVQRSLNTVIRDCVTDEMVRGSNECRCEYFIKGTVVTICLSSAPMVTHLKGLFCNSKCTMSITCFVSSKFSYLLSFSNSKRIYIFSSSKPHQCKFKFLYWNSIKTTKHLPEPHSAFTILRMKEHKHNCCFAIAWQ